MARSNRRLSRQKLVRKRIKRKDGRTQSYYVRPKQKIRATSQGAKKQKEKEKQIKIQKLQREISTREKKLAKLESSSAPSRPSRAPTTRPSGAPTKATPGNAARPVNRRPVAPEDFTPLGAKAARYSTWFKASGTFGNSRDVADPYIHGLLDEDIDDYAVPAQFYSSKSLKKVKWDGIVERTILIDKLNAKLQFVGEETPDFDFRDVYPRWEYRYQIIETIGGIPRIVAEHRAAQPTRKGWHTQ